MLDVRRLRLLRELQIRGTLAEVAAALSYSPSSVSQQLSLLEKEVGVELLRKTGRRVRLTPQAEVLVEHTATILDQLERAEADMAASLSLVSGTVRLAVFQSAVLAVLPAALSIIGRDYPELRVEVTQREPESALFETWTRDFDLVVAEQYPGHAAPRLPELDREPLVSDALRLGVPPVHFGLGIRSITDAGRMPWVMEPRGTASRHWSEQACRQAGFEPDVRFETPDLQTHIQLIESGNAVAILPDLVWVGRTPTVELITLDGDPHRSVFTSTRKAARKRPAIIACRAVLLEAAEQVAVGGADALRQAQGADAAVG
ncbi:MAG: LysR substrate-binding domain-containing protein [Lacisediminihabitans sp.]